MGIKQPECESKGCCWSPLENGSKAPWCFFPAKKGKNNIIRTKEFSANITCNNIKNQIEYEKKNVCVKKSI